MTALTLDVADLRYETFPDDENVYWVRWIDGIDIRDENKTPRVHVILSLIPNDVPWVLSELAGRSDARDRKLCDVSVGDVMTLRLGMVFKGQRKIGDLVMTPSEDLHVASRRAAGRLPVPAKSFTFGDSDDVLEIWCGDENPVGKPSYRTLPWRVLPDGKYPLHRFDKPMCAQFARQGLQVVVPASEVFRAFFAPEGPLAVALLSDMWPVARNRVANLSVSVEADETLIVGLRRGLTEKSATAVAAFLFTEAGRTAVNGLLALGEGSVGWMGMRAVLPYAFDAIEISGDGLVVHEQDGGLERFLMLRIRSVKFPKGLRELRKRVLYRLDNYNSVRRAANPGGSPFDFPVPQPLPHPNDGLLRNQSRNVPAAVSGEARVSFTAVLFEGLPEVERVELTLSEDPEEGQGKVPFVRPVEVWSASSAAPQRGQREVGQLGHVPDEGSSSCDVFDSLTAALDAAKESGEIDGWEVREPGNVRTGLVSGRIVWLVPDFVAGERCRFSRMKDGRRRGCLVVGIAFGVRVFYWLELEREDADDFRLLLIVKNEYSTEDAVFAMIKAAYFERGVWRNTSAKLRTGFIVRAVRHRFSDVASRTISVPWVIRVLRDASKAEAS